ncbi:MAG TPA: M1 family metallopeptidase [Chitinophagaceae bacterium]|nr:M1 family metallopeptidase [Chitinophagaceae bacterium]
MKKIFLFFSLFCYTVLLAQHSGSQKTKDDSWKVQYRAFPEKINNLVHTKLVAKFDYSKSYLLGKAWITLQPHFYATDSLALDAKGMEIHKLDIIKNGKSEKLKYNYDGMVLKINLDKTYKRTEKYTVYIEYTAKPNELKVEGSSAITDAKGLYFNNPEGKEKNKPTQVWTQGETEATSVWVPTIDRPNQKTTQEIYMIVPNKYVTLSNGKLVSQVKNTDGTRTDYWKMDKPHAPYLFFMGIGDYAVVKDNYKGKELSYYVEHEYEKVAKKIFGNTPEMMQYFSKILGVEYPWNKYAQIVGRDYVSGAMENTTATLHQESAQQDARQLVDENHWEGTIAHELFHHWFGDYVTAESWSNLTVNESFANYSQTLWAEYKYGKDAGDEENYNDMQGYLMSGSSKKDLVRYFYKDKEDMFDAVSYNKGGRILHMLRNIVGDDAFFKSLNKYLTNNKFGTGNADKLRLAFEEVTGKDLNWYWNQWFYGSGHPQLDISYAYNEDNKKATVYIKQTQSGDKIFTLPFSIDVYLGKEKNRYEFLLNSREDSVSFSVSSKPDLINVDGDKILLCNKKDNKTLKEYIYQYKNAGKYLDRREAIDFASKQIKNAESIVFLEEVLNDTYAPFRIKAIQTLAKTTVPENIIQRIEEMAIKDKNSKVRSSAIDFLAKLENKKYRSIFEKSVYDSSYSIAGASLEALEAIDSEAALAITKKIMKEPAKGRLSAAISNVLVKHGGDEAFDFVAENFEKAPFSQAKFETMQALADILVKVTDFKKFIKGVDLIVEFRDSIPEAYKAQITAYINNMVLKTIADKKEAAGDKEKADYVKSKL